MITMRSEYADQISVCCGATLHRPADADPWSPFFCFDCGKACDGETGQPARKQCRSCTAMLLWSDPNVCERCDLHSAGRLIAESENGTIAALFEPLP